MLKSPPSEPISQSADLLVAEVAAELNTTTKFVYRRIKDRTLPAYRIAGSRLIRIRRSDVEALKEPVSQGALSGAVADYIEKLIAGAPPLDDEQRTKLAELLKPARRAEGAT